MIEFIDSVMGSGKSTYAIKYIKANKSKRFVVASVILDEVDRYEAACSIYQPRSAFSKMEDLKQAIQAGKSVSISHSLLLRINQRPDILLMIKSGEYELILDEVISDPIYTCDTEKRTLDTLESAQVVSIDPVTKLITWLEASDYEDRVSIRDACLEDVAYKVGSSFAIAHIKPDIFTAFAVVKILTYLSQFSLLYKYFQILSIPVTISTLDNGVISNANPIYTGTQFANLINIDSTKSRNYLSSSLSSSGMLRIKNSELDALRRSIGGFFQQHRTGVSYQERMWTTYKLYVGKLSGDQQIVLHDSANFVQHSSKGTNKYQDVKVAAYAINKYMHPGIVQFLKERNASYTSRISTLPSGLDMWALSEMLQWVWRSRVRKGQAIELYVPSERMRELLQLWLGQ